MPLARVGELLQADPEEFSAAIDDIDRGLRMEIRRLQRHRQDLARLAAGDSLALPGEMVDYLARLRRLGVSERMVEVERDSWIILAAYSPERVRRWIELKHKDLDDPVVADLYLAFDQVREMGRDDPRLAEVPADDFEELLVALVDAQSIDALPAWRRVNELLKERGWTGRTEIQASQTGADRSPGVPDPGPRKRRS